MLNYDCESKVRCNMVNDDIIQAENGSDSHEIEWEASERVAVAVTDSEWRAVNFGPNPDHPKLNEFLRECG